jgi:hypothetical protein
MFDVSVPDLDGLAAAEDPEVVAAIAGWAQVEAAACARRLAAIAELFCRRSGLATAEERACWWFDYWDAAAAEVGAAQGISPGLASSQLHDGVALRDRLPKVAALFAAGRLSYRLVTAMVSRTDLVKDPDALALIDTELAAHATTWGPMSVKKTQDAIDVWVDHYDPGALRRTRLAARGRQVVIGAGEDESGIASLWGRLYATDAAVLDRRLTQLARTVCDEDPRTLAQRRADALGALAAGAVGLTCSCGSDTCTAAVEDSARPGPEVVIHVVGEAAAVAATPDPAMSGETPPAPSATYRGVPPLSEVSKLFADTAPEPPAPPTMPSGFIVGGAVIPAPLLAELVARAKIRPIRHPGDAPPEPGYRPSVALDAFVRCRDLTCRFPNCDRPADRCDIDHTIPYPLGPTHASNLKCVCRPHHLLKTFWCGEDGWHDRQLPDGTVIWTSPAGHTYTTRPGSQILFPTLCLPTGELATPQPREPARGDRGVMMPTRRRTRAQDRDYRINAERALNDTHVAERNQPPPF